MMGIPMGIEKQYVNPQELVDDHCLDNENEVGGHDHVSHHYRSASLLAIAWLLSLESGWAGTGARTAMPGKTNF